jgi:hypothetical protein
MSADELPWAWPLNWSCFSDLEHSGFCLATAMRKKKKDADKSPLNVQIEKMTFLPLNCKEKWYLKSWLFQSKLPITMVTIKLFFSSMIE